MALLEVTNLSQHAGKKQLLHHVSLSADGARVTALLGPNGAGKTTLLRTIMGLNPNPLSIDGQTNGMVFAGIPLNKLSVTQRVDQGLLYLPQHTSLIRQLTVMDNLLLVFTYHPWWQGKKHELFDQEAHRWLSLTGLNGTLTQPAETLSGGQKRKLEVVRSLLMKPRMLMLDEPFAGVDPKSIYELKHLFIELAKQGIGVIISDHHVDQLLSIATTAYVLVGGSVVASGSIQEILENSITKERYLGTEFYEDLAPRFTAKNQHER